MSDIRSAVLVFWDSSDYILEPFSWFDSISFASCDERVDHRGSYSRCIAATEEIVLASYCQRPDGILNSIVVNVLVSSFLSLISSILQRLVKHAAKFRRTHKKVFKKKKKFKDSEKVCLRKRKICMWPLCPCRFFCIFVGIAKGMNDFICRLCVRSVQTFKFY